ncbi:CdaR family transcriptional regulator [Peribacillus alkalitolerans]|uniref:CdaR family transcriptional regulator n=1 Tax=Peribacillus alkalitolerans TaxID=1550385 RepID=UPI0013D4B5FE|nr:sugar diacid recognition domain-containing protein [Peribacillus alkalitolerans]
MFLPQSLANKIINDVRKLLDEELIIVGTDGMIIASTDIQRVGSFHEGAYLVSRDKQKRIISVEDENKLRGVKAGINLPIVVNQDVVGVLGITGMPDKVASYGEIVKKMIELMIQESYLMVQDEGRNRAIESFVFDWIQQKDWDDSFLNRARLLQIDLQVDRQVVICKMDEMDIMDRHLWQQISRWVEQEQNDLIVRWGNDRFVLLLTSATKSKTRVEIKMNAFRIYLEEKLHASISIGIGNTVHSKEVKQSFEKAERALNFARINHSVVFDDDLTLEMVLDDIRPNTRNEFLERTLSPLRDEEELIETLRSYFQHNLSLKKTASSLHIHINTLHYRIKRIEEICKLNPKAIRDLATLYFAIQLLDKDTKNN